MKTIILTVVFGLFLFPLYAQLDTNEKRISGVLTFADGKKIEFLEISGVRKQEKTSSTFTSQGTVNFTLSFFERVPGELVFMPVDRSIDEVLIPVKNVKSLSIQKVDSLPNIQGVKLYERQLDFIAIVTIISVTNKKEVLFVFYKGHFIDCLLPSGIVTNRYSGTKLLGATIAFQH